MIRTLLVVISVFCVATVLSEALGVVYLWSQGQLDSETVQDIRLLLAGEEPDLVDLADDGTRGQPSRDQVVAERSMRVLELNTRQMELTALKNMITKNREEISDQQRDFQTQKSEFEDRLQQLQENNTSDSVEQSRGIVRALKPADRVEYLLALNVEQDIVLLKGLPEKEIGTILQEFAKGDEPTQKIGQEIFEAIYLGEPIGTPINQALDRLTQDDPIRRN